MAIFSKLSTKSARTLDRLSATATEMKAKVGPRLPRGATVVSGIKVSLAIATTLGLSVPYMQGISDAAKQIMACADAMKTNRKECKRITALAKELTTGLLAVTEGIEEEDLDDGARMDLAELECTLKGLSMFDKLCGVVVLREDTSDEAFLAHLSHRSAYRLQPPGIGG